MKIQNRNRITGAVLAGALTLAGTGVAGATIVSIDGGTWDYGSDSSTVWSDYFHNGVPHGSTAVGKFRSDSGCVNKNVWSRATAPRKGIGNESFYRHC